MLSMAIVRSSMPSSMARNGALKERFSYAVGHAGHAQDLDGRMLASSMPRAPAGMVAVYVATNDASARPKTSASASRRRSDAGSVRVTPQG